MADLEYEREDRRYLDAKVVIGLDKDDGVTPRELYLHPTVRGMPILAYVYNPTTLAWERMRQPTMEFGGDLEVTMGDVERLLGQAYYKRDKPYTHGSGRIKYICQNTDIDAAETATTWLIWKYTDASPPEVEGPRVGRVDTVAQIDALSWNI